MDVPSDSPEGEDPRAALEVAYQRRLGALQAVQTSLAEVGALRRQVERDLSELSDSDDAGQLRARHAEVVARQDDLRDQVDALRGEATRCRAERNHVRALADAAAARALAREALARLERGAVRPSAPHPRPETVTMATSARADKDYR